MEMLLPDWEKKEEQASQKVKEAQQKLEEAEAVKKEAESLVSQMQDTYNSLSEEAAQLLAEEEAAREAAALAAAQAADLQAVIEHIGAPANVLAHSAGTLVTLELLRANPAIILRAILHEPAATNEGAGLGAAPVLREMIAAGKVSRALRAFLGAIGDSDPEAPKLTEAEARHALRNGRSFMANEYGITMTCVPDWNSVRASKTVAAVLLGELSIGTPREAGTRMAAELLDCPLVTIPGAHNGLRDRPVAAAQTVRGILGF